MPARVWVIWALFLVRGSFYSAMLPLWEGWDEYAHFAWLQHWLEHGTLPRATDPISREIDESMQLAALPHELNWIGPPYLTHEQWWALSQQEREERTRRLRSLPQEYASEPAAHAFNFYEAQQPPLYYWIAAIPLRLVQTWPIGSRVILIRLFSIALASIVIPLTWLAARLALGEALALYCATLLAVAPGLMIDVARVANDSLTLPLVAALVWLLLRKERNWIAIGVVLGASLLTKPNLIALIPAVALAYPRKEWRRLCFAILTAAALAGWWYGRNLVLGQPLAGWIIRASPAQTLAAAIHINWFAAASVSAKTFLWFGAWSFLTLKSWIYLVLEALGLIAVAGWFKSPRDGTLRVPFAFALLFAIAMIYGTIVYYASTGVPNLPGWYLWPAACPLAILYVAGARRFSLILIVAFALLDLYGANALMMPYYAGLVSRNHATLAGVPEALARLNFPVSLWVAWIAADIAIPMALKMKNRP